MNNSVLDRAGQAECNFLVEDTIVAAGERDVYSTRRQKHFLFSRRAAMDWDVIRVVNGFTAPFLFNLSRVGLAV